MSDLKSQLDQWFAFLRDQEHECTPRANIMLGYAYGYGKAMNETGNEEGAQKQLDWMIREAQAFKDRPGFPGEASSTPLSPAS